MLYIQRLLIASFLFFLFLTSPLKATAQQPSSAQDTYMKGQIVAIVDEGEQIVGNVKYLFQTVRVKLVDGSEKGKEIIIDHGKSYSINDLQKVTKNEEVVIVKTTLLNNKTRYVIADRYRLPQIYAFLLGFFVFLLAITRLKGIGAIIGLLLSIFIIFRFIVPQILAGGDPLLVSITGSFLIMFATIFLAHGFSKQTASAVAATTISLGLTGILAVLSVSFTKLTGLGDEYAYALQFGHSTINVQGLLLGSIIIGALGVLDDVTTTQAATMFELMKTNKNLSFGHLFRKGMNIGREHIVSLVNTLVLAYAGVSLGIFILLTLNPTQQPYWVILNSEAISQEVIRTLVGSMGIMLAVPITTLFAGWIAYTTYHQEITVKSGKTTSS